MYCSSLPKKAVPVCTSGRLKITLFIKVFLFLFFFGGVETTQKIHIKCSRRKKNSYREKKDELARVRVQLHALALENEKLEQLVRDSENASVLSTHDDDDDSNDQRRRFSLEFPKIYSPRYRCETLLEAAEEKARREESMRKDIEMQFQTKNTNIYNPRYLACNRC